MDLVKVLEQTVRDLKREVNLKVLKVPEIEQKVLDATDDEPWGPHGSALAEIAQATKKFSECQMVMNVLWTRLAETGKSWRLVYKALAVIEYLVAHGSERAVDEIIEHTFQISSLASFEYVEPSGKDVGINVRKRAETIASLLNNKDKIQEVRNKAATNSDKYFGLSSSGITYKSGAALFSSSKSSGQYGGFGNKGDGETFRDSYKDQDEYGSEKFEIKSKKEPPRYGSTEKNSPVSKKSEKLEKHSSIPTLNPSASKYDEEFDDFDPRGNATSKPSGNTQNDLFSHDIDLLGEPLSDPTAKSTSLEDNPSDVDLFADADFVSAIPEPGGRKSAVLQSNVDLFASQETGSSVDLFAIPDPIPQPDTDAPKSDQTINIVDPFASMPLNNFDGSDRFGLITSHAVPSPKAPIRDDESHGDTNIFSNDMTKPVSAPKKDTFHVKSGIWADSLSRGLIDLNISAPKKVNLADIGIVGASEEKDKGSLPSFYMGGAIGTTGYGAGKSSFTTSSTTDDFFSSLSRQQNEFGSFQK